MVIARKEIVDLLECWSLFIRSLEPRIGSLVQKIFTSYLIKKSIITCIFPKISLGLIKRSHATTTSRTDYLKLRKHVLILHGYHPIPILSIQLHKSPCAVLKITSSFIPLIIALFIRAEQFCFTVTCCYGISCRIYSPLHTISLSSRCIDHLLSLITIYCLSATKF